jgi:hypothetical protein
MLLYIVNHNFNFSIIEIYGNITMLSIPSGRFDNQAFYKQ